MRTLLVILSNCRLILVITCNCQGGGWVPDAAAARQIGYLCSAGEAREISSSKLPSSRASGKVHLLASCCISLTRWVRVADHRRLSGNRLPCVLGMGCFPRRSALSRSLQGMLLKFARELANICTIRSPKDVHIGNCTYETTIPIFQHMALSLMHGVRRVGRIGQLFVRTLQSMTVLLSHRPVVRARGISQLS